VSAQTIRDLRKLSIDGVKVGVKERVMSGRPTGDTTKPKGGQDAGGDFWKIDMLNTFFQHPLVRKF
jgi:hypothetical protein